MQTSCFVNGTLTIECEFGECFEPGLNRAVECRCQDSYFGDACDEFNYGPYFAKFSNFLKTPIGLIAVSVVVAALLFIVFLTTYYYVRRRRYQRQKHAPRKLAANGGAAATLTSSHAHQHGYRDHRLRCAQSQEDAQSLISGNHNTHSNTHSSSSGTIMCDTQSLQSNVPLLQLLRHPHAHSHAHAHTLEGAFYPSHSNQSTPQPSLQPSPHHSGTTTSITIVQSSQCHSLSSCNNNDVVSNSSLPPITQP